MSAIPQSNGTQPVAPSPLVGDSAAAAAGPRGRASWSGLVKLSLVSVPVKAYPATVSGKDIAFNQLHGGCGQRIRYEKHCPLHGKVEAGAIVSGYQYAPDQYVVIDDAELEKLRPATDKALALERFFDPHQFDPALLSGRTLYLLPDGLAAQHAYSVLAQALRERQKWSLGRIVLSGHRQLALLRPVGQVLALHILLYPSQLRASMPLEADVTRDPVSEEERQLAGMLIDASSKPISWAAYRDDTGEQLQALIEAKLQGRTLETPPQEEVPILRLLDALKQSVASAQKPQPTAPAVNGRKTKKPSRRSA